jgi:hypothetical protein
VVLERPVGETGDYGEGATEASLKQSLSMRMMVFLVEVELLLLQSLQ